MAKIQIEQTQPVESTEAVGASLEQTTTSVVVNKGSKSPSDWAITVVAGQDSIEARCNMTGTVFKGTIAAFNEMLRG